LFAVEETVLLAARVYVPAGLGAQLAEVKWFFVNDAKLL
jgi:hypothetical protein